MSAWMTPRVRWSYGSNLTEDAVSRFVRYFGFTDTYFGILTDGISYRFYSDLDQPNVMDPKPSFDFNMFNFSDKAVDDITRYADQIRDVARGYPEEAGRLS